MFLTKKSSNESKLSIKNLITLNAYTNKQYIFKNNVFKPLDKLTYNTENFTASYLANKDLITAMVTLSRNIPEEDITSILEIKAYEELGLDQAGGYIISSIEVENSGEEREFHLFVTDPDTIENLYQSTIANTKFIDLIVPSPLLYKTLYDKELLSKNGTHCFIYFTHYDAFVTIYKDGEFLYSKSIDFSLNQIYDKYCEMVGEKVDESDFINVLKSEGLKTNNNTYQQNFMKIFGEVFITINDIIIYSKRAFQIDTIDKVYIGSVYGPITGLDEYSQNYLNLQSYDLNFDYNIGNDEWYTDQLQYMLLLASFEYLEEDSQLLNMTMFPRPPSFTNRASGQFIISIFAAISIGLMYPLSYLIGSYMNDVKIKILDSENKSLEEESNKYKNILSDKKNKLEKLDKKVSLLSTKYNNKTKTLTAIYNKKVNYRLKSGIFHRIAEEAIKFDINVDKIFSEDDMLSISIVSSDDRKFTELIKYISETHFDQIKSIDIERIEKDPINGYYTGLLKVELK